MSDVRQMGIGKVLGTHQDRDAIHVAMVTVEAGEFLKPGQRVSLHGKNVAVTGGETVGIVDPYLMEPVQTGQIFWLFLFPGTVTSLKHNWTHPAFGDEVPVQVEQSEHARLPGVSKQQSEQWLRSFVENHELPDYDTVIEAATCDTEGFHGTTHTETHNGDSYEYQDGFSLDCGYITFYGRDAHCDIPREFWEHLENLTGKRIVNQPNCFSCSC